MNYALTEDEFNKLDSVRGQLGLVSDLLTAKGANSSLFFAGDLNDFLTQQRDTLCDLLKLLETRHDETSKEGLELTWVDWLTAIDYLSGEPKMPDNYLTRLMHRLARNAQMYPDMERVARAFSDAIVDRSEKFRATPVAAAKKTPTRKRENLMQKTTGVAT